MASANEMRAGAAVAHAVATDARVREVKRRFIGFLSSREGTTQNRVR
jgi:hypothetical protein